MACSRGLLLLASAAASQPDEPSPSIRVTGRSTVSVQPEQASVDVGSRYRSVGREGRCPAERGEARRRPQGAPNHASRAKFETVSYSLNPVYQYPEPHRSGTAGYSAMNVFGSKSSLSRRSAKPSTSPRRRVRTRSRTSPSDSKMKRRESPGTSRGGDRRQSEIGRARGRPAASRSSAFSR